MRTYSKINTLYVRDKRGKVTNQLTKPIYETIDRWVVREKVDGVNMRIGFYRDPDTKEVTFTVTGRTDDAELHPGVIAHCEEIAQRVLPKAQDTMSKFGLENYILFGEGYGVGIHRGGRYSQTQKFALFDVAVDGGCNVCDRKPTYLSEALVDATGQELGIPVMPYAQDSAEFMTIDEIVDMVKFGFASVIADEFDATFMAEGVIAKPVETLYDNSGERVMFKLKSRDFEGWSKKGVKLDD